MTIFQHTWAAHKASPVCCPDLEGVMPPSQINPNFTALKGGVSAIKEILMNVKRISAVLLAAALLGGCAGDGSGFLGGLGGGNQGAAGIGGSLVRAAIDNQCRMELNSRNEWRVIALAMSADKQREWEDKICGCVSEDAMNQISVADMASMLDANARDQAVAKITARTVTSCFRRVYKR